MTDTEREFILKRLEEGRDAFLCSFEYLSETQLKFKPQPDRWSIADCVEHVALTEDGMYARVTKGAPNPAGAALDPEKYERFVSAVIARRRKVVAPDPMQPTGHFASIATAREQFVTSRARAIEYVRACTGDLRTLFAKHPLLGDIDCYQFLLLLAVHPARHAAQIEEIKSDPGFPKA